MTPKRYFFVLTFAALLLLTPQYILASSQLGEQLSPFSQKDLNGNLINMSTIIEKKPVMLIFWASWCPTCKQEAPQINKLVQQFRERGMEFIGINIGFNDSEKRAQAFIKKYELDYPVIFDTKGEIAADYKVQGVPTIIVADSKGTVLFRNFGAPDITEENFKILMGE